MAVPNEPGSAGAFPESQPIDRSAFGLGIQKDQMALTATGSALGVARRTVPEVSVQFSHPISQSQFGGGGNAKATFTNTAPEGM